MRAQFLILLMTVFLWGCEISPHQNASAGDNSRTYAQVVMSVYMHAWNLPKNVSDIEQITKTSIVIAKDGNVISARITKPSGNDEVDKSVQSVLNKIRYVQPFESGAKEEQRTFTINFDLKAKE